MDELVRHRVAPDLRRGFARAFLDAYAWPPMTDQAIEKLRRKYAR